MTQPRKQKGRSVKSLILILYFALLIVHFIIKDRFHYLSVIYYACPLPLIIILGLFVTAMFFKRKPLVYGLTIILLVIFGYFIGHYFGSSFKGKISAETSHILFWNVAQNQPLPTDILIKHIKESRPEIVALVEAEDVSEADLKVLMKACPDYQFQTLEGTMLIAVKGSVTDVVYSSESDVYKFNHITLNINQTPITVMIADIYASPILNKEIPLTIISKAVKKYKTDILVGDFNTPYESVFFKDFKTDFNSFHPFSLGMTSTWPVPIPVIEIDQIWLSKSFQPIKMEKFTYDVSDHKLLIAKYENTYKKY